MLTAALLLREPLISALGEQAIRVALLHWRVTSGFMQSCSVSAQSAGRPSRIHQCIMIDQGMLAGFRRSCRAEGTEMIASDMLSPLRRPGPGPGASGGLPCPRSRRRRAPRTKSATSRRKHKSVGGAQKEKLRPRRQQGSLNIWRMLPDVLQAASLGRRACFLLLSKSWRMRTEVLGLNLIVPRLCP